MLFVIQSSTYWFSTVNPNFYQIDFTFIKVSYLPQQFLSSHLFLNHTSASCFPIHMPQFLQSNIQSNFQVHIHFFVLSKSLQFHPLSAQINRLIQIFMHSGKNKAKISSTRMPGTVKTSENLLKLISDCCHARTQDIFQHIIH